MTEAEASSLEMLRKQMQYPLIKARALTCGATPRLATPSITVRCARQNCDMPEEMRQDCVDLVITATERYQSNYENAARMVKEANAGELRRRSGGDGVVIRPGPVEVHDAPLRDHGLDDARRRGRQEVEAARGTTIHGFCQLAPRWMLLCACARCIW